MRLLRTDMEKWGDELEKWIYKDILVEYECPKCGQKWTETHPLSESEYKQVIADYITKVTDIVTLKKTETKKLDSSKINTVMNNQELIGMDMSLQIPYKELEAFVLKKYNQQIKLEYADENTISITKNVVFKDATVNISVDQVAENDIMLHYQAGFGIEWIIKGALMWFKETISGFVDEQEENKLLIHLDKISQLSDTLERIEIKAINFEQESINITFSVII